MAFKREIFKNLESNYEQVFNEANLTEDYEMGLRLFKLGYKTSYINLLVDSRNSNSRIATGEYFPNSFWQAVKQRSRWTAGICFQNWKMHKWAGNFKTKYFLLRDRKTIFSNLWCFFQILFLPCFYFTSLGSDSASTFLIRLLRKTVYYGFSCGRVSAYGMAASAQVYIYL